MTMTTTRPLGRTPVRTVLAATAALLVLPLAACGGDESTTTSSAPETSAATTAVEEAPPAATGTLQLWTRDEGEDYANIVARAFEAKTGNTVNVTAVPTSEMVTKLGSAISGGDAPDIVSIDVIKAPYFINAGVFTDLTGNIASLSYADTLLPGQVAAGTYDGKNYVVPFVSDSSTLFYNKELFTQAGLDPEDPPSTWQEFADAAVAVSKLGDDIVGYHFSAGCGGCAAFVLEPMVWASGGDFLDTASGALNPDATFDDPVVVEFITMLNQLAQDGGIGRDSQVDAGENYGGAFENGKLGMVANGSFNMALLEKTPPAFEFGVVALPGKNEGETSSFAGGDVLAIPTGTDNLDLAWEFLAFVTSDEAQKALADAGYTPTRTDILDSYYAAKGDAYRALADATINGEVPYTLAFNSVFSDPNGPMTALMQDGVFGTDVAKAIADAQAAAQKVIDETV
jgi:multiple sugar transport system substrate-binding protein